MSTVRQHINLNDEVEVVLTATGAKFIMKAGRAVYIVDQPLRKMEIF